LRVNNSECAQGVETSFPKSSTSVGISASSEPVESSQSIKSSQLLQIEMGTQVIPPREGDAKTTKDEGSTFGGDLARENLSSGKSILLN